MSSAQVELAKDRRLRQPAKNDYLLALGSAAWCFAACEWNVVWCCERLRPGSLRKVLSREMTAGKIANCFNNVTRNMKPSEDRSRLMGLAKEFEMLVALRNKVIHGKPCTGPSGEARLSSKAVLEIVDLESAADQFAYCSSKLNSELYGFLGAGKQSREGA